MNYRNLLSCLLCTCWYHHIAFEERVYINRLTRIPFSIFNYIYYIIVDCCVRFFLVRFYNFLTNAFHIISFCVIFPLYSLLCTFFIIQLLMTSVCCSTINKNKHKKETAASVHSLYITQKPQTSCNCRLLVLLS